jgi:hypothetical protein
MPRPWLIRQSAYSACAVGAEQEAGVGHHLGPGRAARVVAARAGAAGRDVALRLVPRGRHVA